MQGPQGYTIYHDNLSPPRAGTYVQGLRLPNRFIGIYRRNVNLTPSYPGSAGGMFVFPHVSQTALLFLQFAIRFLPPIVCPPHFAVLALSCCFLACY